MDGEDLLRQLDTRVIQPHPPTLAAMLETVPVDGRVAVTEQLLETLKKIWMAEGANQTLRHLTPLALDFNVEGDIRGPVGLPLLRRTSLGGSA